MYNTINIDSHTEWQLDDIKCGEANALITLVTSVENSMCFIQKHLYKEYIKVLIG